MNNITAVVLAAGKGTRMKSGLPKVLHKVGSKTILGRVIENLRSSGITDITVVVGYNAEQIKSSLTGEKLKFVEQKKLLGSADALKQALDGLTKEKDVLVTCADAPLITSATYRNLMDTHFSEKAGCTVLTSVLTDAGEYGRIIRGADGNVSAICEEKDATQAQKEIKEINVGTYCFLRDGLEEFIKRVKINEKKKEFYLTDVIDLFVKNGKKAVAVGCGAEEAVGINSREDLARANTIMNRKTLEKLMKKGVTIIAPESTYIDESAKIEAETIIFPNTVIEADVEIKAACRIGPFARLRGGSRLAEEVEIGNFVEVCRTKIGTKTRVKHHTYLGDAVVGKRVNVGAGVITANYDGEKKFNTIIEDDVFVGVGAIFVAPVKIGKGAKIGAGSVVTKNKDVAAGETVMGVPARVRKQVGADLN
ncbi:MAG: bifunctional N-acetylglucosamine-1-phosphate uridyltransferase/glucosamine-1-phosphate acetyltransferase [Candidatus Omnitrophica bacterium]|nr:bifunctional N-acetylglucosamine-1-phosphate uridyltransferase/glucosamine-1-phosphate acetyltransferase [Candidatus Omnitrophota bacterium]